MNNNINNSNKERKYLKERKKERKDLKEENSIDMGLFEGRSFFNNKVLFIISLVIMSFSSFISVFAVSSYLYNSNEVSFNNSSSNSINSSNVQGAIDELYADAHNYEEMSGRVAALESRWSATNNRVLDIGKDTTASGVRGVRIFGANGKDRSYIVLDSSGNTAIVANGASGSDSAGWAKGTIDLQGNPVKVNGNVASATIDARSSSADLNIAYTSQPNISVWTIIGQNEANTPSGTSGNIHFVLSFKNDDNWGSQWLFKYGEIYQRNRSTGGWSSWTKKL